MVSAAIKLGIISFARGITRPAGNKISPLAAMINTGALKPFNSSFVAVEWMYSSDEHEFNSLETVTLS